MVLRNLGLTEAEKSRLESIFATSGSLRHDSWGTSLDALLTFTPAVKFLYEKYFRVKTKNIENIPTGPALFVANHGGQIPMDALMIVYSQMMKAPQARLLRGMVERWVPSLPFVGSLFLKLGQVVGDQRNCLQLLKNGQSVLVFPEGVAGSGKLFQNRYQLAPFPSGFLRLALEANVPIVPVAVIGTEENYPSLMNFAPIAKAFGFPYFPITPTFPLLGPLGAIPLPSLVTLRYCDPIRLDIAADAPDSDIFPAVQKIRDDLQNVINEELKLRGNNIFTEKNTAEKETP